MEGRGNPVEGLHAVEAAVRTSLTAPLDLDRPEGRPRNIGKLPKERAGTPSGSVASGVVTAALLGADWWRSDDSVMKAVARLTKTEITNGLDLRRTLRAEGYQLDNPHFQHFLRGHVGEADVFAMLEASGTPYQAPGVANHPGYDLTVDDVDINVKIGQGPETLAEHWRRYPDTPAFVNEDMEWYPDRELPTINLAEPFSPDLLHEHSTVVVDGLSLSGIEERIAEATGAGLLDGEFDLDGAAEVLGIAVLANVVRVARVGIREHRSAQSHGDRRRALLNTATEAASSTGGSFAGLKAGALIGAELDAVAGGATLGLGTVVGASAGAAAGSAVGKRIGNYVKEAPLRRAQGTVAQALEACEAASAESLKKSTKRWKKSVKDVQGDLRKDRELILTRLKDLCEWENLQQRDLEQGFAAQQRAELLDLTERIHTCRTRGLLAAARKSRWLAEAKKADGPAAFISLRSRCPSESVSLFGSPSAGRTPGHDPIAGDYARWFAPPGGATAQN